MKKYESYINTEIDKEKIKSFIVAGIASNLIVFDNENIHLNTISNRLIYLMSNVFKDTYKEKINKILIPSCSNFKYSFFIRESLVKKMSLLNDIWVSNFFHEKQGNFPSLIQYKTSQLIIGLNKKQDKVLLGAY